VLHYPVVPKRSLPSGATGYTALPSRAVPGWYIIIERVVWSIVADVRRLESTVAYIRRWWIREVSL
jgi:hypothetical protein